MLNYFFTLTGGSGWSGVLESFALFQCNRFMYLHFKKSYLGWPFGLFPLSSICVIIACGVLEYTEILHSHIYIFFFFFVFYECWIWGFGLNWYPHQADVSLIIHWFKVFFLLFFTPKHEQNCADKLFFFRYFCCILESLFTSKEVVCSSCRLSFC